MRTSRCLLVATFLFLCVASAFAADITGSWIGQFTLGTNPNVHKFQLDVKADGAVLTGTMITCKDDCSKPMGKAPLENGKIQGNAISFSITTGASDVPQLDFQGTMSGDSINFVISGKTLDCQEATCQIGQGSASRSTSPH